MRWTGQRFENFLIEDPIAKCVDGRSETAYGRRKKIAAHFDRPDAVEPFDGIRYSYAYHHSRTKLSADHLVDPLPSLSEVEEWIDPPRRNAGIRMRNNRLILDRPVLVGGDGGEYGFADDASRFRFAFMYYDSGGRDDAYHPVVVRSE